MATRYRQRAPDAHDERMAQIDAAHDQLAAMIDLQPAEKVLDPKGGATVSDLALILERVREVRNVVMIHPIRDFGSAATSDLFG